MLILENLGDDTNLTFRQFFSIPIVFTYNKLQLLTHGHQPTLLNDVQYCYHDHVIVQPQFPYGKEF